ncbi:TraR/DksA family transcriptional regulator [Niabella insulamsoli]|uniref:TraR/DksA family transcriptional regulator n=2 Tax=Niabella TaxID=379899 RepID=UPI0031FD1AD7
MATKKSAPAKKATPAKKKSKPAVKPAAKTAAKPARSTSGKVTAKAAPKKTAPAKKTVKASIPAKAATKKAPAKAPAKKAAAATKAAAKPVTKVPAPAAAKKASVKAVSASKASAAPSSKADKKQPVKAKTAPKKEKSAKVPVVPKLSTKSAVKYQPDFTNSILDTPKNEKVKSVVRYSDSDLMEFKEIILRKLDAAKKELAYLQGLITRRDEGGDMDEGRYMTMEDGSVSMEREQLSQLASRQITFIDHLEKALMRVENKTYGICRVTGNLIDKARLRAVPHATLSIEAKSMMNK